MSIRPSRASHPRTHPKRPTVCGDRAANPLVRWFDDEVAAGASAYLVALAREAAVLASDLQAEWAPAGVRETRTLMAYLMLTDFAVAKGLRVGEAAMLLREPLTTCMEALDVLRARQSSDNPSGLLVKLPVSRRLGQRPPEDGADPVSN